MILLKEETEYTCEINSEKEDVRDMVDNLFFEIATDRKINKDVADK